MIGHVLRVLMSVSHASVTPRRCPHTHFHPQILDLMACTHPPLTNVLRLSTSPYRLQHKGDPVNVRNMLLQLHLCSPVGHSGSRLTVQWH